MNPIVYFPNGFFHLCALLLALGCIGMLADELRRRSPLVALRLPTRGWMPRGLSGQEPSATLSPRFSQQCTPAPQFGLAA